jgi:hypothetical protein
MEYLKAIAGRLPADPKACARLKEYCQRELAGDDFTLEECQLWQLAERGITEENWDGFPDDLIEHIVSDLDRLQLDNPFIASGRYWVNQGICIEKSFRHLGSKFIRRDNGFYYAVVTLPRAARQGPRGRKIKARALEIQYVTRRGGPVRKVNPTGDLTSALLDFGQFFRAPKTWQMSADARLVPLWEKIQSRAKIVARDRSRPEIPQLAFEDLLQMHLLCLAAEMLNHQLSDAQIERNTLAAAGRDISNLYEKYGIHLNKTVPFDEKLLHPTHKTPIYFSDNL